VELYILLDTAHESPQAITVAPVLTETDAELLTNVLQGQLSLAILFCVSTEMGE